MTNSVLQTWGTLGPHFACYLFIHLFIGHLTKHFVSISGYRTGW